MKKKKCSNVCVTGFSKEGGEVWLKKKGERKEKKEKELSAEEKYKQIKILYPAKISQK